MNQALLKNSGSKRHIAKQIVSYMPAYITNYYEPFLGGGSVFLELLRQDRVENYYLSDINRNVIEIFRYVKNNPDKLIEHYTNAWNCLQKDTKYYYEIRDLYNKNKNPLDYHFLSRTCYNGTIRFNQKGEFNTSYHFNRSGIEPKKLEKIIYYYSKLMSDKNIIFETCDFSEINYNGTYYIDPPYTISGTLYSENLDFVKFCKWLKGLKTYYMTLNTVSKNDNEQILEADLYNNKILLKSGNSSFSRLKNKNVITYEYFYIK